MENRRPFRKEQSLAVQKEIYAAVPEERRNELARFMPVWTTGTIRRSNALKRPPDCGAFITITNFPKT